MKKIFNISFVFIGLVIGAGFASGREVFEFFSIPSQKDFTGIILASFSFTACCYIIMSLSQRMEATDFSSLISSLCGKLAPLVKLFMFAFMFSGYFIMLSACGALFREAFSLPAVYGIALISITCFFVFSFDMKGLVTINTLLVPTMIFGIIFVCVFSILTAAPVFAPFSFIKTNPLTSALCYVSFNTVTAGAVLVPLSRECRKKHLLLASGLSGSVLGILIFLIWTTMNLSFDSLSSAQMPLLVLSAQGGRAVQLTFSAVLFMALCTTAVSNGFGLLSYFRFERSKERIKASAIFCLFALPFSALGFSELVSNVYSAFGYLGFLWMGWVIFSYIRKSPQEYNA